MSKNSQTTVSPKPRVAQIEAAKRDSPCRKACCADGHTGFCFGCGRQLSEIANWVNLETAERKNILAQLPDRLLTLKKRSVPQEH